MNARSPKADALIRDIAKLFVAYSPSVWRPVLDELAQGGEVYKRVSDNMRELLAEAPETPTKRRATPAKKRKSPVRGRSVPTQMALEFSLARQEPLRAMADALGERRMLPTAADIRHVYLESGGKGDLPKARKAAITHLLHHLDRLPDGAFKSIYGALQERAPDADAAGDYQRWFRLIRKPSS